MKNINKQFEEFDCDEFEFDGVDNKILIKAILIAGGCTLTILGALFGFLYLIFTFIF